MISLKEAGSYFNIGIKKMRRMAELNEGGFAFSRTECVMDRKCYAAAGGVNDMSFEPENIELDDTVTFVWGICE